MRKQLCVTVTVLVATGLTLGGQQPPPAPPPVAPGQGTAAPASATNLGADANGNPLRRALKTGHVSNYDEAKVAPFTLPDPLVLADGKPVRDRQTWVKQRRAGNPADVRDRDLRPHAGEDAGRDLAGGRDRCQRARRHGGHEEDRRDDRERTGCAADQADALHTVGGEDARAGDSAGQLRRWSTAAHAAAGPRRRWFSDRPAGGGRDHQPWMGVRDRRVSGHPAGSAQHVHAGRHRPYARARSRAARA